jgi:formate dehydrogenase maturation protein FdhE
LGKIINGVILNSGQSNELTGFVRRVNLTDSKVATQPKLTAETYAQEGIWLDLLKSLADTKSPEAVTQMQEVLKSGKFEAIATQPLLECCKPNN